MQLKIQEASSNAPLAVAYIPTAIYSQLNNRKNAEPWVQITDHSHKVKGMTLNRAQAVSSTANA